MENARKINIKITIGSKGNPIIKQLPHLKPEWNNYNFAINQKVSECDYWIVYGELPEEETVACSPDNIILITNEPVSIKKYNKDFTDQFSTIVTCNKEIKHPDITLSQQGLPWWIGHNINNTDQNVSEYSKSYDELTNLPTINKTKLVSTIISNKSFTPGHKKRIIFLDELKKRLGDRIDVFGNGFNKVDDKWDAISPYKYHIALENSCIDDYWTEKLADTYLSGSYPLYYGCPNLQKYFPEESYTKIDITDPKKSIDLIEEIIRSDTFEKSLPHLEKAKKLILNKYQFFPMICEICNKQESLNKSRPKQTITLHPEQVKNSVFTNLKNILKK